jgi:hypothetical protein
LIAALTGLLALGPAVSLAGGAALAAAPGGRTAYLRAGQTGSRSAVPWNLVGPGWVLAMDWLGKFGFPGKPKAAVPVLYLFNPAGGRYRLHQWPSTKNRPA